MKKRLRTRCLLALALLIGASQPLFAQRSQIRSSFGDEQWDARFLPPGLSNGNSPIPHGSGVAIAVIGSDVYVGGIFTSAGGVPVNNIAKWDGRRWSALGSGITGGSVRALATYGGVLYVGGDFTNAGGVSVNSIAKWDGSRWSALRSLGGVVHDIAFGPNGEIYAAGNIGSWGHIAKWDGNSWSDLGGGVSEPIFPGLATEILDVAVKGSEVYVCGRFKKAGTVSANQIAKWNGSQWSALGGGITQTNGEWISSVEVFGNRVVAGGLFFSVDNVKANCIAAWDGTRWLPMGPANNDGVLGTGGDGNWGVWGLAVFENILYAAGAFESAGGQPANNLARWNGSAWTGLQSGSARVNQVLTEMAFSGNAIYTISAGMTAIGDIVTNSVAKFENGDWSALGASFDASSMQALAVNASGEIYIGGKFSAVAGMKANRIVKWNRTTWSTLGSGLDGQVRAIAVRGNEVFVGGNFKNAGGAPANNIAKWNGQDWSPLGSGISGNAAQVNAIAIKGSEVYVGGQFSSAGGVTANNIAKWDGGNWSAVGAVGENGVDAAINAIAFANNGEVYVGGSFTKTGSVNAKGIAMWNGTSWSALGSGITGSLQWVYALASSGDEIYVGGRFTAAGGITSNHLAKWNSTTSVWSPIGGTGGVGDATSSVFALTLNGNELIVGGSFAKAGNLTVNHLAKWDGSQWFAFGSGLGGATPTVLALAAFESHLYGGGLFTIAGNKPSFKFAHWEGPTTAVQEERAQQGWPKHFALAQNYPNPFNPSTTIQYQLPEATQVRLAIYNLLGERVRTLVDAKESVGAKHITWDGRNDRGERVSSGVYLYRIEADEFKMTKRLVVMK